MLYAHLADRPYGNWISAVNTMDVLMVDFQGSFGRDVTRGIRALVKNLALSVYVHLDKD